MNRRRLAAGALAGMLGFLAGCGGSTPPATSDPSATPAPASPAALAALAIEPPPEIEAPRGLDGYEPRPADTLTFNRDIAPLIYEHCSPCHRPGEAAPFPFLTYSDVKKRASQIVDVIRKGFMPPWLPEPGYADFAGVRELSVDETGMLQQWISEGAREGNPADRPPPPEWTDGWQLGEPDLVVRLPETYTLRADPPDVFRNFVIPDLVDEDHWVRALEFRPGNGQLVHHAEFRVDRSEASRRLDAEDPEAGFDGMDAVGATMPDGHFLGWAPGASPPQVPPGMPWRLGADTDLVVQLHLLPSGKRETVDPTIGLFFSDEPPVRTPFVIRLGSRTMDIPPEEADYRIADAFTLPVDVELLAVFPHAHYLGKDMKGFAVLPDGTKQWLLRIKDWDFNWQDNFRLRESIDLPAGTTLVMQYGFDNSSDNVRNPHFPPRRVRFGPSTYDEMADLWLQVLPKQPSQLARLQAGYRQHDVARTIERYRTHIARDPEDANAHNNLGHNLLTAGKVREALEHFEQAVRLDPDYAHAKRNLAITLHRTGEVERSARLYREALELEPDDPEAWFQFAHMHWERRLPAEAAELYARALELRPAYPEAHFFLGSALRMTGRPAEALPHLRETVRLEPDWVVPLRETAWLLATHPELDPDAGAEATRLAEHAVELTGYRDPTALEALAAAQAAAGRFDTAARTAQTALTLVQDPRLASRIREQIERYRRQLPAEPQEADPTRAG
jgi:tetratricopeptide (TPR) repeat protein